MRLSFDDKESFMEAAGSLRFNNPPSDPDTIHQQVESINSMPAQERSEDTSNDLRMESQERSEDSWRYCIITKRSHLLYPYNYTIIVNVELEIQTVK